MGQTENARKYLIMSANSTKTYTQISAYDCLYFWVALRLLCAVAPPFIYDETSVTVDCAGTEFTTKGRTVKPVSYTHLDVY